MTISELATRWNVDNAVKRLESTLIWRRALGLYDVEANAKELEPEVRYISFFLPVSMV